MHPSFCVCSVFLLVLPLPQFCTVVLTWYQHSYFLILCHCWKQCFGSFGCDMTCEWCSLVYLHRWQYLAALQSGSLVCDTWRQKLVFFIGWKLCLSWFALLHALPQHSPFTAVMRCNYEHCGKSQMKLQGGREMMNLHWICIEVDKCLYQMLYA